MRIIVLIRSNFTWIYGIVKRGFVESRILLLNGINIRKVKQASGLSKEFLPVFFPLTASSRIMNL